MRVRVRVSGVEGEGQGDTYLGNMLVLDLGTEPDKGADVHSYFTPGCFPQEVS